MIFERIEVSANADNPKRIISSGFALKPGLYLLQIKGKPKKKNTDSNSKEDVNGILMGLFPIPKFVQSIFLSFFDWAGRIITGLKPYRITQRPNYKGNDGSNAPSPIRPNCLQFFGNSAVGRVCLSGRDLTIIELLRQELPRENICRYFNMDGRLLDSHIHWLCAKLRVTTETALIQKAIKAGILL
jgi:DNA-binding CsgD family transcriptional regulator